MLLNFHSAYLALQAMCKKKRRRGGEGKGWFTKDSDPRINASGRPSVLTEMNHKKRYDTDIVNQALSNEQKNHATDLQGVRLRPCPSAPHAITTTDEGVNDIVDLSRLRQSQSDALRLHRDYVNGKRRPPTKHLISLTMNKVHNRGFGVSVHYTCKQCKFVSPIFKLYATTTTGGCATNVQAAVALSKVPIKSSDAAFLFSSLNLNAPVEKTLQKHFTKACSVASAVLEESLSQNRSVVRDYLQVVGRSDDPDCPSASVSLDGQFNRPIYHGYDGKSTSVSEPVIENETNLNLLVSHAVVSKLDGTYEKEKVIFLIGETFSQNVNYYHSFFFATFYSKLAYKWG